MTSPDADALREALDNLSGKRHVIQDEALRSKDAIAEAKEQLASGTTYGKKFSKKLLILEEFNDSVKLLISIFRQSNLDEMALFVSQPNRVLILNFCIGILRGMGFAIGFVAVGIALLILIKNAVPLAYQARLYIYVHSLLGS